MSIDLAQPPEILAACDALLPSEERTGRPEHRVARAAMRSVVAGALGVAPGRLEISRHCAHCGDAQHGKPSVAGVDIAFSLSHSDTFGIVAVAPTSARLGVDVERVRERTHLDRLATRVLAADALDAWERLPEAQRLEAFLRAWTSKEAYLKATGEGILSAAVARQLDTGGWTIERLAVPDGFIGALAVDRTPVRVTTGVWDPSLGMAELQAHPGPGARDLRD